MGFYEKKLDENLMFKGRLLTVTVSHVELQDGTVARREVVRHPGGVCVVPVDKNGNVIAVRQYRYAVERELLEIPAGKLEAGEEPADCALRELSEETGCTAEKIVSLGILYATPGYCGERMHLFLATGLTDGEQHLDRGEFLSYERIPLDEMVAKALNGEINDAKTVGGLLRAKAWLEQHPKENI